MRGPSRVDVSCPSCSGRAVFAEPFQFLGDAPRDRAAHRWGGWFVVENYPELLPWHAPKGSSSQYLVTAPGDGQGYTLMHRGVVECPVCGNVVHVLTWPDDAWWQWSIRGKLLWAWDRQHAEQILAYVAATDRPPRSTSGPIGSIPTHFLTSKIRDQVVKAIQRKLAGH